MNDNSDQHIKAYSAAIKNTQYEHVINLSPGFFSQFILKGMKSKEKVSAPFILKKYLFSEKFFNRKTIDTCVAGY